MITMTLTYWIITYMESIHGNMQTIDINIQSIDKNMPEPNDSDGDVEVVNDNVKRKFRTLIMITVVGKWKFENNTVLDSTSTIYIITELFVTEF